MISHLAPPPQPYQGEGVGEGGIPDLLKSVTMSP